MSGTRRSGIRHTLKWAAAALLVIVAGFAVARVVDSALADRRPDALSHNQWLWARWSISVTVAFAFALVFWAVARRQAARWFIRWSPVVAFALLVLVPLAVAFARSKMRDPQPVPHADLHGVTQLDVVIAARRAAAVAEPGPPPPLDRTQWNTRWSVAFVGPSRTRVVLDATPDRDAVVTALTGARDDNAPRLTWRPRARHVLLVDPHALPVVVAGGGLPSPEGSALNRPDRFAARALAVAPPDARKLILLFSDDERRGQKMWRRWARAHNAGVVVIGDHGAETVADVGWRAAVVPGTDTDDAALAWRFRPHLLFHSKAPKREGAGYFPINVDDFIATRRPRMCRARGLGEECRTISRAEELDGSYDFLDTGATHANPSPRDPLPPPTAACDQLPPGIPPPPPCVMSSPLYWFARHHGHDVYLGYWWFFPFNQTPVFRRSTCGPLAGYSDIDCFDHASDWEGVTVLVHRTAGGAVPIAVIYEQHGAMVRRPWQWLVRKWGTRLQAEHPLVFVASGSHASYPTACSAVCRQEPLHPLRPDGPRDGGLPWPNNTDDRCQWVCLLRVPVTAEREPALWAAFPGRWGRRVCIWWDAFCSQTTGPKSPGRIPRFSEPWEARTFAGN